VDLNFFFLSDVWLDHPQTLRGLQKMFDNCVENSFIPKIIVFCGNFTSRSITQGNGRDLVRYQGRMFPQILTRGFTKPFPRDIRCVGRFDRLLPTNHAHHSLPLHTGPIRQDCQFHPTSTSPSLFHRLAIEKQDSACAFWDQSMPNQVLQPGDCRLQRRHDV
jgi:hypothetical protein